MDNSNEYTNYWETIMFVNQTEELDMSYLDDRISGYSDSSSPDGGQESSVVASKNIESERNRRKKLNDRLYSLRAVVPNITKMDKASIIKDAIEYIQSLHDEEQRIQAEIAELENGRPATSTGGFDFDQAMDEVTGLLRPRIMDYTSCCDSRPRPPLLPFYPIQLLELRVSQMTEKTMVMSLTCAKGTDTMVRLCEIFESLNLNIISATFTAFSERLIITIFLEGDEDEKENLRSKIQEAIAGLNDPDSPMMTT